MILQLNTKQNNLEARKYSSYICGLGILSTLLCSSYTVLHRQSLFQDEKWWAINCVHAKAKSAKRIFQTTSFPQFLQRKPWNVLVCLTGLDDASSWLMWLRPQHACVTYRNLNRYDNYKEWTRVPDTKHLCFAKRHSNELAKHRMFLSNTSNHNPYHTTRAMK